MRVVMVDMPKHWLEERKNSEAAQWDEMWDGVLHMPPMPNRMHQRFERDFQAFLQQKWAKPIGGQVDQEVNLTTPEDEAHWTLNYRIPDLVLLPPDRFHIERGEFMAGAPLVVVEVRSPGDETYEKFPFYAGLGVPEVWVFDRDTRTPELYALGPGPKYAPLPAGPDGWVRSLAAGVEFRPAGNNRVSARIAADPGTAADLPDD